MREIVIIISIITLLIVGTLKVQNLLEETSSTIVGSLENLKENVENKNIGKKELERNAEEIYSNWKEVNEKWSNIALHEEMDLIETALIRTKSKIENERNDESLEDIETAIFLINHIKEKEKTSLKNIF